MPAAPSLPPELDPRRPAPTPTRGRSRRVVRVLSWIAVVLSAVVLVASTGLYFVFHYYDGKIGQVNIRQPGAPVTSAAPAAAAAPAMNILLVGSDTRQGKGDAGFGAKPGSPKYVAGARSDTIMLVHIPSGDAKATMVSFPRDSWVDIPAYTDRKTGARYPAHKQRINSAFSEGGPALLVSTVEQLSGLHIDHYLGIDFAGFQNMVNALGGVTVCVRTTRHDQDSQDYLTAGTHHINGKQALGLVRDRKGLPGGDLDRIKDQQYFLSVLLHKVLSAGTLVNPLKLNAFLVAATNSMDRDRDLSFSDLLALALRMRHLDPAHLTLVTAPVANANANIGGADVVLLDDAKLKTLFASLRGSGSGGTNARSSAPTDLTVRPAQVRVHVDNGAGTPGLAARAAGDLRAVGFSVTGIGNSGTGASSTVVRYGSGDVAAARTLAAAVPGAVLQSDPSVGNTLELVVGSDYAGARSVSAGASSSSSSSSKAPSSSSKAPKGSTNAAAAASSCAP